MSAWSARYGEVKLKLASRLELFDQRPSDPESSQLDQADLGPATLPLVPASLAAPLVECFAAVAEELDFDRAAGRLGIAPANLTRALQTLERRLGVQLVGCDSRRVVLTDAGRDLLAQTRRERA